MINFVHPEFAYDAPGRVRDQQRNGHRRSPQAWPGEPVDATVAFYDKKTESYRHYADGVDPIRNLFNFKDRQYACPDRTLWREIRGAIDRQIQQGKRTVKILDIGCGPAIWDLRIIHAYRGAGVDLEIVGLDLSDGMLTAARENVDLYSRRHGMSGARFEVVKRDLTDGLPFDDAQFDVTLCLYTVLNHLPAMAIPGAIADILRVTGDVSLSTVRSQGGLPTVYACGLSDIAQWRQTGDWLHVTDHDGDRFAVRSHLFDLKELRQHYCRDRGRARFAGLDVITSRLQPTIAALDGPVQNRAGAFIGRLERVLSRRPAAIQRANHIQTTFYVA